MLKKIGDFGSISIFNRKRILMKCQNIKCEKEHDSSFGSGKFCSRSCANSRKQTLNTLEKKSLKTKQAWVRGVYKKKEIKKRTVYTSTCLYCCKQIEDVKYNKNRKYHVECWRKSSGGLRINSTNKNKSLYKGYQMDSGAETGFAIFLDKNNIKWEKNKTIFFQYTDLKGKERKYYPDFYLPEYNQWVEIKGKFYANKDICLNLKLEAVKGIKIIYSNELKNLTKEKLLK